MYCKIWSQLNGIGPYVAATLLITAGDNLERLKKESSFAALCGVSLVEVSLSKTVRHRLNTGGSKIANNAIWTMTLTRMRSDLCTQQYVARGTKEGMLLKEIQRCLKRYIIRGLFSIILNDLSLSTWLDIGTPMLWLNVFRKPQTGLDI